MDRDYIVVCAEVCESALAREADAVSADDLYAAADWADLAEVCSARAFAVAGVR